MEGDCGGGQGLTKGCGAKGKDEDFMTIIYLENRNYGNLHYVIFSILLLLSLSLRHSHPCSSLRMKHQVSHSYKRKGETVVLQSLDKRKDSESL
jgi:hypothetical protein